MLLSWKGCGHVFLKVLYHSYGTVMGVFSLYIAHCTDQEFV
jgi:hypothetical protein